MSERTDIRPNDTILHKPTGETWVVCGVDREKGKLIPLRLPVSLVWPTSQIASFWSGTMRRSLRAWNKSRPCKTEDLQATSTLQARCFTELFERKEPT